MEEGFSTYLFGADGGLAGLGELLDHLVVVAEILLATNKEYGNVTAEVKHLGVPLRIVSHQSKDEA